MLGIASTRPSTSMLPSLEEPNRLLNGSRWLLDIPFKCRLSYTETRYGKAWATQAWTASIWGHDPWHGRNQRVRGLYGTIGRLWSFNRCPCHTTQSNCYDCQQKLGSYSGHTDSLHYEFCWGCYCIFHKNQINFCKIVDQNRNISWSERSTNPLHAVGSFGHAPRMHRQQVTDIWPFHGLRCPMHGRR